ncbi:MAG: hypothetical protein H6608_02895 [Flavobacteriales bacterium]|nr:hypothetical protein [Bacteroidota bacterium]MCB9240055.1 hypothetical protein [Flavobacteriales bacterium]
MKWINLVGLVLQFLAFWFAAPELLGTDALRRFEKGMTRMISALPTLLIAGGAAIFGIAMAIYGTMTGLKAAREGASTNPMYTMIWILGISVVVIVYLIGFSKRTQRWASAVLAEPLVQRLIHNNESRRLALVVGAILFTLGFLCQVVAVVLS